MAYHRFGYDDLFWEIKLSHAHFGLEKYKAYFIQIFGIDLDLMHVEYEVH